MQCLNQKKIMQSTVVSNVVPNTKGTKSKRKKTQYLIKATILDKRNRVIATAVNSFSKTHPTQLRYAMRCGEPFKSFLHAEILALIRAKGRGHKIVVERYNKAGEPVLAKPCPICMLAIKEAGIERIEFTL